MGKFTDTFLTDERHPPLKRMLIRNSASIYGGHPLERLMEKWGDWEVMNFFGFNIEMGAQQGQLIYFLLRKRSLIITLSNKSASSNGDIFINIRTDTNGMISQSREFTDYSVAKQVYDHSIKKAEEVSSKTTLYDVSKNSNDKKVLDVPSGDNAA
jgi:hypothetical protein